MTVRDELREQHRTPARWHTVVERGRAIRFVAALAEARGRPLTHSERVVLMRNPEGAHASVLNAYGFVSRFPELHARIVVSSERYPTGIR